MIVKSQFIGLQFLGISDMSAIPVMVEQNFGARKYGKKLYCFSNMIRKNELENDFKRRYCGKNPVLNQFLIN